MKNNKVNYFLRVIGFIPMLVIALVFSLCLLYKYMKNYCLYGGETIVYTHKNERKTINEIYRLLEESLNKEK